MSTDAHVPDAGQHRGLACNKHHTQPNSVHEHQRPPSITWAAGEACAHQRVTTNHRKGLSWHCPKSSLWNTFSARPPARVPRSRRTEPESPIWLRGRNRLNIWVHSVDSAEEARCVTPTTTAACSAISGPTIRVGSCTSRTTTVTPGCCARVQTPTAPLRGNSHLFNTHYYQLTTASCIR